MKYKQMLQSSVSVEGDDNWSSSTDVTEVRRRQQLTTDEVVSSTEEVRHTFVIKSVTDPRTQDDISLEEAVVAGIIDQASSKLSFCCMSCIYF